MSAENRSEGRSNVFLAVTLTTPTGQVAARVRNISARGALVEGRGLPAAGTRIRLLRGQLSVSGEVAWIGDNHAGLNFDSEIEVRAWVARVGHSGQQRVDELVSALRTSGKVPKDLEADGNSKTLKSVSEALDRWCERLAAHPGMSGELGEQMIELDTIAEAVRKLANRK